jgi:hypothetical protein
MRPQAEHRRLPEPLGEGRGNRAATAATPGRAALHPVRLRTPPNAHHVHHAPTAASKSARRDERLGSLSLLVNAPSAHVPQTPPLTSKIVKA